MVIIETLTLLFCGTFFGAAAYISLAQHPATLQTGTQFAAEFFPPMYALASRMQIALAVGGTLAGATQWYVTRDSLWAAGAALLFFVIPFTLVSLNPINDQLLESASQRSAPETDRLLNAWAPRHWVRTIASGLSFIVCLWASVNA